MYCQPVGNSTGECEQTCVENVDLVRTGSQQAYANQTRSEQITDKTLVNDYTYLAG